MTQILVIEANVEYQNDMVSLLTNNGFTVSHTSDPAASSIRLLADVDVIVCGCEIATTTRKINLSNSPPIIFVADNPKLSEAVAILRGGAADYLPRGYADDELLAAVERCIVSQNKIVRASKETTQASKSFQPMFGQCAAMQDLFKRITKVAPTESTVLIQGESGTGKELVARALHTTSTRAQAPMICLNCAAIPETLIESELFGHEQGAFTGASKARNGLIEAADGGTLFLDEIGELPMEAQARLLRVLQEGEIRRVGSTQTRQVSIRLITATHRDLLSLTESGHFRKDLFYRLNVVSLCVPPLRDREDDILGLARWILKKTCAKLDKPTLTFSPEAEEAIGQYSWPGNVRELENAIERAVILCDDHILSPELLAIEPATATAFPQSSAKPLKDNTSLEDYFVAFVQEHQDTHTETELAKKLGISRKSLWERRQRLNIPRRKTKTRGLRRDQPN